MDQTLPIFLAHALAMEHEAALRYADLAEAMAQAGNAEVAEAFRDLARYSELHSAAIRERAAGLDLPHLHFWQTRWRQPPEAGDETAVHAGMGVGEALAYALENERRGIAYYAETAATAPDGEVRRLAAAFVAEEEEHVRALLAWRQRLGLSV